MRSKIQHYQAKQKQQELFRSGGCEKSALPAWWYSRPPVVLPGQVVIFYSPEHYPKQLCVKRCMAISGFLVATTHTINSKNEQQIIVVVVDSLAKIGATLFISYPRRL